MRTIVHLSDLHFGRVDPAIPPALLRAVAETEPDLVVVSGDFTQRARVAEFEAAAQFLRALPGPILSVPGNHDVPLYDLTRRWLSPLGRYRRYITDDLGPFYEDSEIAVLGVNTARALTFKNGRINQLQVATAMEKLARCERGLVRVIVTHHPFDTPDQPPGDAAMKTGLGRADMAMAGFIHARVDLILSGHLHVSGIGQTTTRYRLPGRTALLIQAGTATSTRRRGEVNTFNVVRVARPAVAIDCLVWQPVQARFLAVSTDQFEDTTNGWSRVGPA